MLNATRWTTASLISAAICVTAAMPAAGNLVPDNKKCFLNTEDGKIYCILRDDGTTGTTGPVRQYTPEELRYFQEMAIWCMASEAGQATDDAYYQANCVRRATGDPGSAAREVVASMQLQAPSIGIVPEPGPDSVGLVGVPNWMWVDNPEIFATISVTATIDAWTIGVVGQVAWVDWDMGDGQVVRCTGPGTPYQDAYGLTPSPDCGHTYTRQGTYTVTATAHWVLQWFGGGQTGTFTADQTSNVPVTIGEAFAVRRG